MMYTKICCGPNYVSSLVVYCGVTFTLVSNPGSMSMNKLPVKMSVPSEVVDTVFA